ncbi:MAG: SNF2-related protein [Chitinivibrionales bacterium]|nr:SNF2-related protein [Chitinivibrionales bacterium]
MSETSTDLKFFTNEENETLHGRFSKTLEHAKYFDVLVGYFRTSGFNRLYKSLEKIEQIRILVGLNIDLQTYEIYQESQATELDFESHKHTCANFSSQLQKELEHSEDTEDVQISVQKFIEYLKNGKLVIRAYPSKDIHAKVYITRYAEPVSHVAFGSVITGSSNFSESGFVGQREFNVELKDTADVKYALDKFEKLWEESVDLSGEYIQTIQEKTWLSDSVSPYELYLKLIYEYMEEDINLDEEFEPYLPDGFIELKYQKQAAIQTKKILSRYNGVFIADVVGLGKTFTTSLLLQQLYGKTLVICPPVLADYWRESLFDFGIRSVEVESLGKLSNILKKGTDKFDYIVIDEAHRFRNEATQSYAELLDICRGKKVILVTATPLNNKIDDIFSQLKLFQLPKQSSIPGVPNLEDFFSGLNRRLSQYAKDDPQYKEELKIVADQIRDKVLKYVMVRRTRTDVLKYYSKDLKTQGVSFPDVADPQRLIYEFKGQTEIVFNATIELLIGFKYARYTPLLYLTEGRVTEFELQQQRNIGGFMKGILVKRLESSFFAFRNSVDRFCVSYTNFIDMFKRGAVYISKDVDVFELLENDDIDLLEQLVVDDKIQKYGSNSFTDEYLAALEHDLTILLEIQKIWKTVQDDPKLDKFSQELSTNVFLRDQKIIVFTESKETAEYLFRNLSKTLKESVFAFSGKGGLQHDTSGYLSKHIARDYIIENYDPSSKTKSDSIKILITTDILAEGINLHRSNVIVNYDLPWNPTRVLQRVGRINRIGTKHNLIHIFNFFPTTNADEHLGLEANVIAKIQLFHNILGEDAKYLSDGEEFGSRELFEKLNSRKVYTGESEEEDSELKYLTLIRDIRDNNPDLFKRIKNLPKKCRSARKSNTITTNELISFFRNGYLKKFYSNNLEKVKELTFFDAVDLIECPENEKRESIEPDYFKMLSANKDKFEMDTCAGQEPGKKRGGSSNVKYILFRIKAKEFSACAKFTESDEEFIRNVQHMLEQGTIAKKTAQNIRNEIEQEEEPLKVLKSLQKHIKYSGNFSQANTTSPSRREVILSCYLKA